MERLFPPNRANANPGDVPKRWRLRGGSVHGQYGLANVTADELGDFASAVWVLSLSQVCMGAIRKTYARREVYAF